MANQHIIWTPEAIEWMAAAVYSQYIYDPLGRLPHYAELPERLKNKWREIGRQWLDAVIPLLDISKEPPNAE